MSWELRPDDIRFLTGVTVGRGVILVAVDKQGMAWQYRGEYSHRGPDYGYWTRCEIYLREG